MASMYQKVIFFLILVANIVPQYLAQTEGVTSKCYEASLEFADPKETECSSAGDVGCFLMQCNGTSESGSRMMGCGTCSDRGPLPTDCNCTECIGDLCNIQYKMPNTRICMNYLQLSILFIAFAIIQLMLMFHFTKKWIAWKAKKERINNYHKRMKVQYKKEKEEIEMKNSDKMMK